jgi:hypothetical protein
VSACLPSCKDNPSVGILFETNDWCEYREEAADSTAVLLFNLYSAVLRQQRGFVWKQRDFCDRYEHAAARAAGVQFRQRLFGDGITV